MTSYRADQVGEQVREEIMSIIRRDLKDPRIGFVSITAVRMSPDLRQARVYAKPLLGGDEEDVLKALRQNTAYLQREVAQRLGLKFAPRLKFLADESFDEAGRIERLLSDPRVARDLGDLGED